MTGRWWIEGHAIVSADDCIADASGRFPDILRNDVDWALFQAALDAAAVVVLGRPSHLATPNTRGRSRLVMTSTVAGIERRSDGLWWNPAAVPLNEALDAVAPPGGIVAVPGGHMVFDYFLGERIDAFYLSRSMNVRLPGGTPVFSEVAGAGSADAVLKAHGLVAGAEATIDAAAAVTRTIWRRAA